MTTRIAYDELQFCVFSEYRPSGVPAGRYEHLDETARHANTVTYKMFVVDQVTGETVYRNWEDGDEDGGDS